MSVGLYIHVPFCLQKCHYCDFVSYPYDRQHALAYVTALEQEMRHYGQKLAGQTVSTVFIGGGTPTVLPEELLTKLLLACQRHFVWENNGEVTVEANPGTVDQSKLHSLKQLGVNRLSLGVQACQQPLLKLLGRIHNYRQAQQAMETARQVGFTNISLDLIFALPGQGLADWRQSLKLVTQWQPEHLSCYSLQLEEGTPLAQAVQQGKLAPCPEEQELAMYYEAIGYLTSHGYQHYEISNFARPGYRSRHNLSYWQNEHYIGLGPAAHSHYRGQRWANTAGLEDYVQQLARGRLPVCEQTSLTKLDSMIETMFMGLRLLEGVNLHRFYQRFGQSVNAVWPKQIDKLVTDGLLEMSDSHIRLTAKGLPIANTVFAEFV